MPIIKSAKKRVKLAARANIRNSRFRRSMREAIKAFDKAVAAGKTADISAAQTKAVTAIDIAVKKNLIHKNKAARQKSALSAKAKAAGVKNTASPAKKAAPAIKPAAKKPSAPKKPASKATAKPASKKK